MLVARNGIYKGLLVSDVGMTTNDGPYHPQHLSHGRSLRYILPPTRLQTIPQLRPRRKLRIINCVRPLMISNSASDVHILLDIDERHLARKCT